MSANEGEKAGGYALQTDGLNKHQDKSAHRVFDSIVIEHRFEPAAQKMKNEEKVERDKEAVDDQLDQKISEGVFSGPFHMIAVRIGDISGWRRLVRFH